MRKIFTVISILALSACGTQTAQSGKAAEMLALKDSVNQDGWLEKGSIMIARPLPIASSIEQIQTVFGFIPHEESNLPVRLVIEKSKGVARLVQGSKELVSVPAEGLNNLPEGQFKVIHKQRHPLWYAPDQYFTTRGLAVPEAYSKDRYLKGALGEYAIFFDKDLSLHNSPVECAEVGGIRLGENDIARLYYQLESGAEVHIQ